ncbi:hypothetical protein POSPLADRAFT_1056986 [Postia placenta MAD-698-R-SB12]|uniref:Uncharacterized protein n=1 Tax=Postia placenta MAD-698-R-SB12 TaxID=670580 RepID=A0A1X6N1P3_9APHY|nr:hypothetical protein POSPLADRAFT_1056986 [Postia placenta MAD-698-R-SB12]OSX62392.1 hypothetical protein POSPLADRAFT_1056986 [Postia placenta MAD-698-R-SB12]
MYILNDVAEERNLDTIARCTRVCGFFRELCKKHLQDELTFRSEEDVERIKTDMAAKEIGGWRGPRRVTIRGEVESKAIPHMATFASKFAGRWNEVYKLTIENASWPSSLRAADAVVFRDLSRFASITNLFLNDVTFPSIVTFGAFTSALSSVIQLSLTNVKLTGSSISFDPRTLSDFRLLPLNNNLRSIILGKDYLWHGHESDPSAWPCYTELLAFMIAVSNPCGKSPRVYPWGSVHHLQLDVDIWWKFSSSSISRLLRALPSLEDIEFKSARSNRVDIEIEGVPAHPRLKPITIGVHCAYVQPQHVARIIHCLIDMDYPLKITRIYTAIYPFLQEADRLVASAINKLVQHAGPSLDNLGLDLGGHRWNLYYAVYAAAAQYRQCDLFANTNCTSLRIGNCHASWLGVHEVLSHVTSRCVSSVSIDSAPLSWGDRGELIEGLSQLDTVLLLPVFDNLVHVLISVRNLEAVSHVEMEEMEEVTEWAHEMKSCMARLHERGILGIEVHDQEDELGLLWDDDIEDWKRYDSKMDENGNVEVVEVPAFKGGAPSEAMVAYTAWKRSSQKKGDQEPE